MPTNFNKCSPSRQLVYFLVSQICLAQHAAFANTIIAIQHTKDSIIVAADSRFTGEGGNTGNEGKCKIAVTDPYSIFVSAGVTPGKLSPSNKLLFLDQEKAQQLYDPSHSLKEIADRWALAMEAFFSSQSPSQKDSMIQIDTKT
jgi:hypothetical protein